MDRSSNNLFDYLHLFWSKEKLGKKPEMLQKHFELLKSYFEGQSFEEFFNELNKSTLNLQETNFITYEYMYDQTLISHFLSKDYLTSALNVTSSQPSIGPRRIFIRFNI